MKRVLHPFTASLLALLCAWTVAALVAGCATAPPPRPDESQLLDLGFKALVATTAVQQEWVGSLTPGQIRPMQRNGRKFFIYPDASRNQIYVGGPREYEAYQQRYPDDRQGIEQTAREASAYRLRQDDAMRKATARDLSDPFLGASWVDLGW
jgi:hypothetical protein